MTDFGNVSGNYCRLAFAADSGGVGQAAVAARAFGKAAGIGPDMAARLAIIVEELVANLVDHAALPADAGVVLELAIVGGDVQVVLDDPASPFDPRTSVPCADLSATKGTGGAGAGLAMIRAWSQIESYTSANGRNRLVLRLAMPG